MCCPFFATALRRKTSYRIDGRSLTSLFREGNASDWRSHLHLEMGAARVAVTKDWSYIAVRHTKEQIAAIKKAAPQNLPKAMSYIGRLGIGGRGADRPGFFDEDQLYHLMKDPKEMKNLSHQKAQATRLKEMRHLMQRDIEAIGRPFGEFIPGGNAATPPTRWPGEGFEFSSESSSASSPNSLKSCTITGASLSASSRRQRRRSVVLPEPRKPQRVTMGTESEFMNMIAKSHSHGGIDELQKIVKNETQTKPL
ncbi:hypothetical protein OAG03_03010 [Akkermansiaceae bacterium]|nr:hypothetical protein [Akkermansiaceae bacterium]